jgi:hypothetical protein
MATPQGWYADPNDPTIVRWWDGQQWTSHTHPRSPRVVAEADPT